MKLSVSFLIGFVVFFLNSSYTQAALDRNLGAHDQGTDVVELQEGLRKLGFFTYPDSTGYFGLITSQAVQAFQSSYNIVNGGTPESTGYGFVGPRTRAVFNSVVSSSVPTTPVFTQLLPFITRDLWLGVKDEEVKTLQRFLEISGHYTYPEITGYFGPVTKEAVASFQRIFGIAPLGGVGPMTRERINQEIQKLSVPTNNGVGTTNTIIDDTIGVQTFPTTPTTTSTTTDIKVKKRSGGGGGGGGGGSAPDTTAPSIIITSPADTETISGSVTILVSTEDASGVANVTYILGTSTLGTETISPFSHTFNSADYAEATTTLYAVATDNSGNRATTTHTVVIRNQYHFTYLFSGSEPAWSGTTFQPATGSAPTISAVASMVATDTATTLVPSIATISTSTDIVLLFGYALVVGGTGLTVSDPDWTIIDTFDRQVGSGIYQQWGWWWRRAGSGVSAPTISSDGTMDTGGGLYATSYTISGAAWTGTPFEAIATSSGQNTGVTSRSVDTEGSTRLLLTASAFNPEVTSSPSGSWSETDEQTISTGLGATFTLDSISTTGLEPDNYAAVVRSTGTTTYYGTLAFAVLPAIDQSFALTTNGQGYFYSGPSVGATVGKSHVIQEFESATSSTYRMAQEGDVVRIAFDMALLKSSSTPDGIKVLDIECKYCVSGSNLGIRLDIDDGYWRLERSKLGSGLLPLYASSTVPVPKNTWINVVYEMQLGDDTTGTNKLWVDDVLILDENGVNMPYSAVVGGPLDYEGLDRAQIGVTANSQLEAASMLVDNFDMRVTYRQ